MWRAAKVNSQHWNDSLLWLAVLPGLTYNTQNRSIGIWCEWDVNIRQCEWTSTLHDTQVRIQDLCKGGGGQARFCPHLTAESQWRQKFGPQNWVKGGPPPRSAPETSYRIIKQLKCIYLNIHSILEIYTTRLILCAHRPILHTVRLGTHQLLVFNHPNVTMDPW